MTPTPTARADSTHIEEANNSTEQIIARVWFCSIEILSTEDQHPQPLGIGRFPWRRWKHDSEHIVGVQTKWQADEVNDMYISVS